jgi:hypothetical protein
MGPKAQPWITARWLRWRVWTGTLPGADFAPDQIQDDWAPEFAGAIPLVDSLVLRPWARMQVERIAAWNGTGWGLEIRSRNIRAGMDLSWKWGRGSVRLSAGREWNDPGWVGWTGGFSAQALW